MNRLPQDPFILLSWANTQLRDNYPSLEALCEDMNINQEELSNRLREHGYEYNQELNKFW